MSKKIVLGPKVPKNWTENIKPFIWGFVVGWILAFAAFSSELSAMQKKLDDPHHCVSVCVEAFEKWGC